MIDINLKEKHEKVFIKTQKEMYREYEREVAWLRSRDDYLKEYEYFLELLSHHLKPHQFKQKIAKPVAGLYCVQVPLELFDALNYHPLRLFNGFTALHRLSSPYLSIKKARKPYKAPGLIFPNFAVTGLLPKPSQ